MINYLMDEHVPPLYRAQLLRREPSLTVWKIGNEGAPTTGSPDPVLLCWCEENDFALVTNNRKSMPGIWPIIWRRAGICPAFSS